MKFYQEQQPALAAKMQSTIMDFIKKNPNSEASAAIIPQLEDLAKMKEAANLLGDAVKNGRMKSYYQDIIARGPG